MIRYFMKYLRILFCAFIMLSIFSSCKSHSLETNMSEKVDNFHFTTQHSNELKLEDLKGKWWLAYFMYTECTQVCPTTTANMLKVENKLNENDLNAQIVSFSVDPDHDTPEVLQSYAVENDINLDKWTLLTGYEFDEIKNFSAVSFKANLDQGNPGETEFAHSTNFFLVNPEGEAVKKYDGMGPEETDTIIEDLINVSS